jgi:nicotinate-nucleotide adenylyltransferase
VVCAAGYVHVLSDEGEDMKVAVYGGSFDPPHLGHVMVVSHLLLNDPSVDKVLIVPCFQQTGKQLASVDARFEMCIEAFSWLPRTAISSVEHSLGGESETLRTMKQLKQDNPDWELRFVMGSDLMFSCKSWDGWEELEKLAPPMPIGRAGIAPVREGDPTPISPIVSSSIIRKALNEEDYAAAERYLPVGVLNIIQEYRLYFKGGI